MRMGRVSIAMVAFGVLAAACGGARTDDTTTTTTPTTATVASTVTTSSTSSTTIPPTTTTAASSGIPATATITLVQSELKLLGFFDEAVDGIAGEMTRVAIAKFQAEAGVEADGEFGPITDGALAAALQKNESYVSDVQDHLVELKLYPGPVDGDYGKGTKKAVTAFQTSCEIEETGTLDIATRLCLAKI